MTRIGIMSDVHLEFGAYDGPFGEGKVLLVAGDLHVAGKIHSQRAELLAEGYKQRSQEFFARALESYDHVACVMGNHEHYHGIFEHTADVLDHHFASERVHLLDNQVLMIPGAPAIFGSTMWTDFNRGDADTRKAAKEYMADYQVIYTKFEGTDGSDGDFETITPDFIYDQHLQSIDALNQCLASTENGPLIVMSHHGPSKRSVHPRYTDWKVNGAYSSNLENYMWDGKIPLWVHGHTHDSHDYVVGKTRVICNPRGYVGHHLNPKFQGDLVVEI